MKKLLQLFTILLLVSVYNITYAQPQFWGMTSQGGQYGAGVIFKTDGQGNSQSVQHSFLVQNEGKFPFYTTLVQAANGKFYGVTSDGGVYNFGVLFEYDPVTDLYAKKIDFNSNNGKKPFSSLIMTDDFKLYGVTREGGTNGQGVLFQYDPITNAYIKKIDFDGSSNGSNPWGALMKASDGKLYGMTTQGGTNNQGTLFQYDPSSNSLIKKIDFNNANGSYPQSSLMQAVDGKLYGMTRQGGTNNQGTLFQYEPSSNSLIKKIDFSDTNGTYPQGYLMQAGDGKLYGMTYQGGTNNLGVLFQYDPSNNLFTKKFDFDSTNGSYPQGSLMQASDGKLYGMTAVGGAINRGVLFQFDPATNVYAKKLDFNNINGTSPQGSLMQASDGKLYGVTNSGGAGNGILFQYDPVTNSITKKIDFAVAIDGSIPYGSLILASDGKLYGMTSRGGVNNGGVLFQINPANYTYTKKIDFNTANGINPQGSLIEASDGKMYGMTNYGGINNFGVLFQYDPTTNAYTKKIDFNGSNGKNPYGGALIPGSDGKLYGMTTFGGTNDLGVLFSYDPGNNSLTKKIDFVGTTNGRHPEGSLILASDGKLYGMTRQGGTSDAGVLFQYDPSTNSLEKKIDFVVNITGQTPHGSLILAGDNKLYAMNQNALIQYDPATNILSKKVEFNNTTNGANPFGSLMLAGDGKLYGMTNSGGTTNSGVIFQYDPLTSIYTKTLDFNVLNGMNPYYSNLIAIPQPQFITFNPLPNKALGDPSFTLTATASSGLSVSYTSSNPAVATVSGNIVTIVGVGSTTITASQAGNASFGAATSVDQILTVKLGQTITFGALGAKTYGDADFALTATASSGLSVNYMSSNPSVATITGSTVTIVGAGTTVITASQPGNINYVAALSIDQTLIVSKAAVTASADAKTKLYGDVNPVLTITYTGFKGTDNPSVIDTPVIISTPALTTSNVGSYPITLTGGLDNNYILTLVNSTLTINKATLTATAATKTKLYGDVNPALTFTYSGFKGTDNSSVIDTPPTISTTAITTSNVGSYPITLTGGLDNNYALTLVNSTLTINKSTLTVTAGAKTKVYGDVNPALTFTYTGFKGTDNSTVIDTPPTISTTALTTSNVGSYPITLTGGLDNNYALTLVNSTLTITKATLTATAAAKTKVFGDVNPALTFTYTGFKGADNSSVIDTPPTISTTALTTSNVGSYPITLTGGLDNNYAVTLVNSTLTINKATLTATADAKTKLYGDVNPTLTITYTGFKGADDSSVIDTPITISTTALTTSNVGSYPITLTGGLDNNYSLTLVNSTLTINKAGLTVTADSKIKFYGDVNPALTITYTGFKGSDDALVLDSQPVISTTATNTSNAGTYPITLTAGLDNNYTLSLVNGIFTINKANLIIAADPKTKVYFTLNPELTFTYSGFVIGEDVSVLDLPPSISTTATLSSSAGSYPITLSGGLDNNYAYSLVNSLLTIYKEEQIIIFPPPTSRTFGDAPFVVFAIGGPTGNQVTFTSSNPSVISIFGNVATVVGAGNAIITSSQAGNINYNAATSVMQPITVNMASQTITFSSIPSKNFGDASFILGGIASSGLPISYTSSDPGVATIVGGTVSIVGVGTATITATQSGNINYSAAADVTRTLTVNPSPLVVTPSTPTICLGTGATINATGAATYLWSPATGLSSTTGSSVIAKPSVTTTYSVTATYPNGFVAMATTTIKVNAMPLGAGGNHSIVKYCGSCGGTVTSSGLNSSGQLGNGTTTQSVTPVTLSLSGVDAVSAGSSHSLFVKSDGTVWATGLNTNGQLGDGTIINKTSPVQVVGLTDIIDASAGSTHSVFLKSDGTVWAVGLNTDGQLGDGTVTQRNLAVQVVGLTGIIKISAGGWHSLFLKNDGTVWATGRNTNGQLGDGTIVNKSSSVLISSLSNITHISAGGTHSHFLRSNGTVLATGLNTNGQLGNGTTTQRTTPGILATINFVTAISGGASHTIFLRNDGTAWSTGLNSNGQLGDGTTTQSTAPVPVGLTGVTAIDAGVTHSLFLTDNGLVWAAGRNANGQLGDGTTSMRPTPVQTVNVIPCARIAPAENPAAVEE
ncbi:MAG: hypothetical protein HOP30_03715, partial [Cyclobacteriaceae bacterium]|nr:hypothetical protein [Cyclobacteriaceae bacterium]